MSTSTTRRTVAAMAVGRVVIGAAAVLVPGPGSRLLGFPPEQDSPSARLSGRLFGVRDVALGALVWRTRDEPSLARYVYRLNAWVDAGDATAMAVAVIGRQGIDRAAASSAALALTGAAGWLNLLRLTGGWSDA